MTNDQTFVRTSRTISTNEAPRRAPPGRAVRPRPGGGRAAASDASPSAHRLAHRHRRRPLGRRLERCGGGRDLLRDQSRRQHPASREDRGPDRLRRPVLLRLLLVPGARHPEDPGAVRRPRRHQRRSGLRRDPPGRREPAARGDRLLDRPDRHPGRLGLQRRHLHRGLRTRLLLGIRGADREGRVDRRGRDPAVVPAVLRPGSAGLGPDALSNLSARFQPPALQRAGSPGRELFPLPVGDRRGDHWPAQGRAPGRRAVRRRLEPPRPTPAPTTSRAMGA